MDELQLILEGYYTFGEILAFFFRLWLMILLIIVTAAIIKYHEFILTELGNIFLEVLTALAPVIIVLIGIRLLFRAIFH